MVRGSNFVSISNIEATRNQTLNFWIIKNIMSQSRLSIRKTAIVDDLSTMPVSDGHSIYCCFAFYLIFAWLVAGYSSWSSLSLSFSLFISQLLYWNVFGSISAPVLVAIKLLQCGRRHFQSITSWLNARERYGQADGPLESFRSNC